MYRGEPKEPSQFGSVSGSEIQNWPFSLSGIVSLYRTEPKDKNLPICICIWFGDPKSLYRSQPCQNHKKVALIFILRSSESIEYWIYSILQVGTGYPSRGLPNQAVLCESADCFCDSAIPQRAADHIIADVSQRTQAFTTLPLKRSHPCRRCQRIESVTLRIIP